MVWFSEKKEKESRHSVLWGDTYNLIFVTLKLRQSNMMMHFCTVDVPHTSNQTKRLYDPDALTSHFNF